MSLSLINCWKFLNKRLKLLFGLVILGNFVVGQEVISAPENFNPNLESSPETDSEEDEFDNNIIEEVEVKPVEKDIPKVKPSSPVNLLYQMNHQLNLVLQILN